MRGGGKLYKRLWKIVLITVIMALLLCSLSSCGQPKGSGDGGESGAESSHADSGELSWRARRVTLDRQYASAAVSEDMLYGAYYEGDGAVVEYLRKDYGDTLEVFAEKQVPLAGIFYVQKMFCDSAGNVYVFGLDEKDYSSLWRIDPEGNVQTVWDVPGEESSKGSEEEISYPEPKAIFEGEDGSIYIWYSLDIPVNNIHYGWERIYKLSPEGEVLFYAQVYNRSCISILKDSFGELLFLQEDEEGLYTQAMDPQSGELAEAVRLKEGEDLRDDYPFIVPEEGAFLFCEGTFSYGLEGELYEFRLDTQKRETVLDLSVFGIYGQNVLSLTRVGENMEVIDNPTNQGNSEFTLLEYGEWKEEDEIVLTLALTEKKIVSSLDEIVTAFNRSQSNIRIEIEDYKLGMDETGEIVGLNRLETAFAMGTAPDILDVDGSLDVNLFAMNGAFVDLYGLMEGDKELNRDSFVSSVLKSYEVNGGLYQIGTNFALFSMCGNPTVLGNKHGLTFGELMETVKESGKGAGAIAGLSADYGSTLRLSFEGTNACELFYAGMDEFIDWENGSCDFESDNFQGLLQFAREYRTAEKADTSWRAIQEGSVVAMDWTLRDVADYQIAKELFGGEVSFIGYPAGEEAIGVLTNLSDNVLAINGRCRHPEAAWEFIKYVLLHYREYTYVEDFPVVKEQLEEVLEQSMVQEYWPGEERTPVPKGSYGRQVDPLKVYAAAKEDVEAVKELIERVDGKFESHREVMDIINEEIVYYFEDQKSAEEVAKIIQSRVSLWLQEQM